MSLSTAELELCSVSRTGRWYFLPSRQRRLRDGTPKLPCSALGAPAVNSRSKLCDARVAAQHSVDERVLLHGTQEPRVSKLADERKCAVAHTPGSGVESGGGGGSRFLGPFIHPHKRVVVGAAWRGRRRRWRDGGVVRAAAHAARRRVFSAALRDGRGAHETKALLEVRLGFALLLSAAHVVRLI